MYNNEIEEKNNKLKKSNKKIILIILMMFIAFPIIYFVPYIAAMILMSKQEDVDAELQLAEMERMFPLVVVVLFVIFMIVVLLLAFKAKKMKKEINKPYITELFPSILRSRISSFRAITDEPMSSEEFYNIGFYHHQGYEADKCLIFDIEEKTAKIYPIEVASRDAENRPNNTFDGYIIKMSLEKNSFPKILIKNKLLIESLANNQRASDTETGNPEFNSKFSIKTDSPDKAVNLLSGELVNYLVSIDNQNNFKVMGIRKEGVCEYKIEFAVDGHDLYIEFYPRGRKLEPGTIGMSIEEVAEGNVTDIEQALKIAKDIYSIIENQTQFGF